jgi:hypothetical protein
MPPSEVYRAFEGAAKARAPDMILSRSAKDYRRKLASFQGNLRCTPPTDQSSGSAPKYSVSCWHGSSNLRAACGISHFPTARHGAAIKLPTNYTSSDFLFITLLF